MSRVTPDFGFETATQNKRQRSGLHSTVTLQEHCIFAYSYKLHITGHDLTKQTTEERSTLYSDVTGALYTLISTSLTRRSDMHISSQGSLDII